MSWVWAIPIIDECRNNGKLCPSINISPQQIVQKILAGWPVTEEDIIILWDEGLKACDIIKLKTLWILQVM